MTGDITPPPTEALHRRVPASLTVIIPTFNSARTLQRCLTSARAQCASDGTALNVNIIVVDNHSTDSTALLAAASADIVDVFGPERSTQRNRGLALCDSEAVLFIDSDMVLAPDVCAQVLMALAEPGTGAVVVPEVSFGEGFWAACRGLEKRIANGDPRTEAARGFRRSVLLDAGPWNEGLTAAEDWDLTDRVKAAGWDIGRTVAQIRHDEGRPTLRATFRKKRYYGQWLGEYLRPRAEGDQIDPAKRARMSPLRILGRPKLLLRRPHLAVGLLTLKAVDAAGISLGILRARRARSARLT